MPTILSDADLQELPSAIIQDTTLLTHVSWLHYQNAPLYFGRERSNRFDSPDDPAAFGTFYSCQDLNTALMESVFHASNWSSAAQRTISLSQIEQRSVILIGVKCNQFLRMADLTAPGCITRMLGLSTLELVARNYPNTQKLAKDIHQHLDRFGHPVFDGIFYPSLKNTGATCYALFDRANIKIEKTPAIPLKHHKDWPAFINDYKIKIIDDKNLGTLSERD